MWNFVSNLTNFSVHNLCFLEKKLEFMKWYRNIRWLNNAIIRCPRKGILIKTKFLQILCWFLFVKIRVKNQNNHYEKETKRENKPQKKLKILSKGSLQKHLRILIHCLEATYISILHWRKSNRDSLDDRPLWGRREHLGRKNFDKRELHFV